MKSAHVKLSEEAVEDINESFLWYERQSAGLGFEFVKVIDSDFLNIAAFPKSFPVVFRRIRKCVLKKFPFNIYYQYGRQANEVKIIRVLHAKRLLRKRRR